MVYYKMNSQTIVMCVVSFLIGMLLAHMLKSVCGCKVVEGYGAGVAVDGESTCCCGKKEGGHIFPPQCENCYQHDCFNHHGCYNVIWGGSDDFKLPKKYNTATAVPLCKDVKVKVPVGECQYEISGGWGGDLAGSKLKSKYNVTREYCYNKYGGQVTEWTKTQ